MAMASVLTPTAFAVRPPLYTPISSIHYHAYAIRPASVTRGVLSSLHRMCHAYVSCLYGALTLTLTWLKQWLQVTGPKGHWSEEALVRRVTGPNVMV